MYELLPSVNATLNGLCTILLLCGYVMIKRGRRVESHKRFMVAACITSALFLISYVVYHAHHGSTRYMGEGILRPIYFTILITHVILAAAIVPLVIMTFRRGWKRQDEAHRRIARWTFPLWLYVSITGVVIYLMLYRF